MKKLFLLAFLGITMQATSQTTVDKINKTNYDIWKVNNTVQGTNNSVNGTTGTIDNSVGSVKNAAGKVSDWFGLGKKTEEESSPENNSKPIQTGTELKKEIPATANSSKTVVTITNCNYNVLRELSNNLSGCSTVSAVEKALNNGTATITLTHNGTTDSILDYIESKSPNRFNVSGLQNGLITLVLK